MRPSRCLSVRASAAGAARRLFSALLLASCAGPPPQDPPASRQQDAGAVADQFVAQRTRMVDEQIRARDIRDTSVLAAMLKVPRHRFVRPSEAYQAYEDYPLPIGQGQTISQPYIVAYMTAAAQVSSQDTVLEIGTGSGYQAAVLGELAGAVYSIEIIPELAERARGILRELGYENVHVKAGDGYQGWAEHAPYDAIVVTAAPDHVPPALVQQLAENGRMVIPVGAGDQEMMVITKTPSGITKRTTIPVRFVPMTRRRNERR